MRSARSGLRCLEPIAYREIELAPRLVVERRGRRTVDGGGGVVGTRECVADAPFERPAAAKLRVGEEVEQEVAPEGHRVGEIVEAAAFPAPAGRDADPAGEVAAQIQQGAALGAAREK